MRVFKHSGFGGNTLQKCRGMPHVALLMFLVCTLLLSPFCHTLSCNGFRFGGNSGSSLSLADLVCAAKDFSRVADTPERFAADFIKLQTVLLAAVGMIPDLSSSSGKSAIFSFNFVFIVTWLLLIVLWVCTECLWLKIHSKGKMIVRSLFRPPEILLHY